MSAEISASPGLVAWRNIDTSENGDAFIAWTNSRGNSVSKVITEKNAHSSRKNNPSKQVSNLGSSLRYDDNSATTAEEDKSSIAKSDLKDEVWDSDGTIEDETGPQTTDMTATSFASPSLPSTYDDPISPKTLKPTRNNPDIIGDNSKPQGFQSAAVQEIEPVDYQKDPTNKLDFEDNDHNLSQIRLQTPTQQQIAARIAGLSPECTSTVISDRSLTSSHSTEKNPLLATQAIEGIIRQRPQASKLSVQVLSLRNTNLNTRPHEGSRKSDKTLGAADPESDHAIILRAHLSRPHTPNTPNVTSTALNPQATAGHLQQEGDNIIDEHGSDSQATNPSKGNDSNQSSVLPKTQTERRTIVFNDLPKDSDYYLVQALVHGGTIQTMSLSECSASVTLTSEPACRSYISRYPTGITFRHKNKLVTVSVSQSTREDKVDLLLEGQLSAGVSRVVRVTYIDEQFTIKDLEKLAHGLDGSRMVESVIDIFRSGIRSTVFRFTNIADSVRFKTCLTEDEEIWGNSNIRWIEDPCARAIDLHFD